MRCVVFLVSLCALAGARAGESNLEVFPGCRLVEAEWADGDSFPVKLPDGKSITVRLYGVDCIEQHIRDDSDARRLRAQRRYFGLPSNDPAAAIARAKEFAKDATDRVAEALAEPFTVATAFADGRGDSRYPRVYAFVQTASGEDLGAMLVREGLARAFGVSRARPDGITSEEYREQLRDLELTAAASGRGVWAATDWALLGGERRAQRTEDAELAIATGVVPAGPVDPNVASRDELLALPGVGEELASRIIEGREQGRYRSPADLDRVPGVGPALIERLAPHLEFR